MEVVGGDVNETPVPVLGGKPWVGCELTPELIPCTVVSRRSWTCVVSPVSLL